MIKGKILIFFHVLGDDQNSPLLLLLLPLLLLLLLPVEMSAGALEKGFCGKDHV